MRLPPGPSSPALVQTWRWIRRPYELLDECRARYGKTFTLSFVGGRKLVMTSDTALVKEVFSGDPEVFLSGVANVNFRPFFGAHSVVVLDGDPHKQARRLLMPPFRGERMEAYADGIRELTLADLKTWPVGEPFPLLRAMQRLTLDVIYEAVFGLRDPARRALITGMMAKLMTRTSGLLAFMPALQVDLGRFSPWGRYLRMHEQMSDIYYEEIAKARAETEGREDILARMIVEAEAKGIPLSDEFLRDQLMTLVAAGHETTATALGWTFMFLLSHPEVLEKARAEIQGVVGDGPVRAEHVKDFDYLDAVLQEALRLYPPIPIVLRWLSRDHTVGGYEMPTGTRVCPCGYLLHREPELYPDPLAYKPERLLGARPGPFEFMAFGGGARTCVGIGFAYFEMKVVLATLLPRVQLRLAGPPSLDYTRGGIVLAPKHGTPVVVDSIS
jgi:cytochrome P450